MNISNEAVCGAYRWGEPEPDDDNPGARCTLKPGHTGPHVDHDNHYGPVIWDNENGRGE